MKEWNIMLAGVGGQGLVLTTKIICDAAWNAGRDVKSNDVIGLAQRGGKIWGSVRIGDKVHAPNIPPQSADILIGLEPLETLRWSSALKYDGKIYMNTESIIPVPVVHERESYPTDIVKTLREKFDVIDVNANEIARNIGNLRVANSVLIGMMSIEMDLPVEAWIKAIRDNVPPKSVEANLKAFENGIRHKSK